MDLRSYHFINQIKKLPFVEAIWLFGSRARGHCRSTSDIDLAISCPKATLEEWQSVCEIVDNADTLLNIDCIRFDTLSDNENLKKAIMNEKIPLFEKNQSPEQTIFNELGKALNRLHEAVVAINIPPEFKKDVVIQRFEFVYELLWKTIQKIAQKEGLEVSSPKAALKTAFSLKLIDNETLWLQMHEDRNLTSHTYKEALANEIASRIERYLPDLQKAYQVIKRTYF